MNIIPQLSKLSLTHLTTLRWALPELVAHANEFGFAAVGLWLPHLTAFGEEKAIDLIFESGLKVSSLGSVGGFTGTHGYSQRDAILDTRDALHLASRLGAESLTLTTGARSGHTHKHARRLVVTALRELAPEAEELNIQLTVKPMRQSVSSRWTFLHEFRDAVRLVRDCNHPSIKVAFGTWHLWDQSDLCSLLERHLDTIGSVQLADGTRSPSGLQDQCLLGEGEIPFDRILRPMVEGNFTGFYELDVWSPELWSHNSVDLLSHCRDQLTRTVAARH